MDEKRRRPFTVYRKRVSHNACGGKVVLSHMVASGLLYDEGNVQVLWRLDIGNTAEQYSNISQLFGIIEGANTITIEEEK